MKKLLFFILSFLVTVSASAYSYSEPEIDFEVPFALTATACILDYLLMVVLVVLFIVMAVKVVNISRKINQIASPAPSLQTSNDDLLYLVALGNQAKAQELAEKMVFDNFYNTYRAALINKAMIMNKFIEEETPMFERLGISMPNHLKSGAAFIDYMNGLTGGKVSY